MARTKGADEIFCRSCGEAIKQKAEICPQCGVRNENSVEGPYISRGTSKSRTSKPRGETSDLSINVGSEASQYGLVAVQWGLGIILLLAGFGALVSGGSFIGWIISVIQGIFFITIGALLIPPVRAKVSIEHPMSTFGQVRSVNQELARNSESPCDACYDNVETGVSRVYKEQFVLFGVPLFTSDQGRNTYCRNCADGEPAKNLEELNS